MSKIPRSFVTPSSKLPLSSTTPKIEPPKFVCPTAQTPQGGRNTPLHDITADKNKTPVERIVNAKKLNNGSLKRPAAAVADKDPPKKLVKLSKTNNVSAKIPAYDYKARYNDLAEKFQVFKSEHTALKDKYDEHSEDLESVKSSYESALDQTSRITNKLQSLTADHEKLNKLHEDLTFNYNSEKSTNENLTKKIQDLINDVQKLKDELINISSQLFEVRNKLSNKTLEYDLLKTSFEKEVQKCSQLNSMCEENQIKLLSLTSEVTFLNTRQKSMDQKNEENNTLIANLKQEKDDLILKVSKLSDDLCLVKKELEERSAECVRFTAAYNAEAQKCAHLDIIICENREQITHYEVDIRQLTRNKEYLEDKTQKDSADIDDLRKKNIELQKTIETMYENEKRLRNEIQDLKGHIRVFCRIRPSMSDELSKQLFSVDVINSCTMEIDKIVQNNVTATGVSKKQKHNFIFDGIFPQSTQQSEVFQEVSSLIQSALDGYNVCIFAYGQTGSGKTYTMEGGKDSLSMGIVPRAIELIFSSLPELKKIGWEFKIYASFMEIYNENIYDLLDASKDQDDHVIKMSDSKGTDIYVSNLKEESVNTAAELMRLLTISQRNRQTAATHCNERSSRSHSISNIKICAFHKQRKEKYTSNLNLVDLAGSESAKTSQRMDETKCINKSLLELSKVILALQAKQSHIPYRNSKLTHVLMPSLGGNSKTLMLVNISQEDDCYQETLNSLRFAAKVNSCRNGAIKKNIMTA